MPYLELADPFRIGSKLQEIVFGGNLLHDLLVMPIFVAGFPKSTAVCIKRKKRYHLIIMARAYSMRP